MIPLLILGLLKQNPGSYGYELLALMEEKHYQYIVSFTKGSFYYNLQQLEAKQFIEQVDSTGSSRETHNYVITEAGNKEFEKLMLKYGSRTEYVNLTFYAAMLFAGEYQSPGMKELIKMQISQTRDKISLLERSIAHDTTIPAAFRKMLENSRAHHLVNVQWFEGLLREMENGI